MDKKDWDLGITTYADMFNRWFDDVCSWEESNLGKAYRFWICFTRVPLFLWHEESFKRSEFGVFIKVSPRSKGRRDLSELWLKINLVNPKGILPVVAVASFHLGIKAFKMISWKEK